MKIKLTLINLLLLFILSSCSGCFGVKESYFGNNIYLSEYDEIDRRIFYQEVPCSNPPIGEIVPMTVIEISHNSKWILVKSDDKRQQKDFKYWVIKNEYEKFPSFQEVKDNTVSFVEYDLFKSYLTKNNIKLKLKR